MPPELKPAFISERITPEPGSSDVGAMSRGEPGVPKAFVWRGGRFETGSLRSTRRDMGTDRGDVYVRRHYYEIETVDQLRMVIYFDRNPSDRSKRKAWWLYTLAFPEPVIVTPRLTLRRWTYADRDDFRAMVADTDTMIHLHDSVPLTSAQADDALHDTIEHYAAGYGDWAIVAREGGAIMGESGLTSLRENGEVELGYMLRRPYWGRGYAFEAAAAVKAYAFDELRLERIVALSRPENAASIKILERLDMKPLGRAMHRGHDMLRYEARSPHAAPG
jgi:RimJ/RimL family protein N-acetyltransferase